MRNIIFEIAALIHFFVFTQKKTGQHSVRIRKPGNKILFLLVLMFPILLSMRTDGRDAGGVRHRGITVTQLEKFIGTYGFMENDVYWTGWNGYHKWLDLLHMHHIHYAKFWLSSHVGNIKWLFAYKIRNGNTSTPPNQRIYDLYSYNKEYFRQLERFVDDAYRKKIVVNLNVFDDCHLRHVRNKAYNPEYHNVQGIRNREDWYSSARARDVAKKFWDKVYNTLKRYPNVIYTVCNENYDFPKWQEDMARYMSKSNIYLDTGDSKITPDSKKFYVFVSIHGQIDPKRIAGHPKQDNLIFSSDGGTFRSTMDHNELNRCVRTAVRQGKGYEFYIGTAQGWSIKDIVTRLGDESMKILGF